MAHDSEANRDSRLSAERLGFDRLAQNEARIRESL
jgi:hypothetical protein